MMKSVVLSLISLFLMAGAYAGVDVKLKFHYNDYPLCNWEVRLEHNSSPVGSVVTDRDGVATFSNITLFSKEVDVYLYMLPHDESADWNGHGTICLNDDYTGDVDFGPDRPRLGSSKAALERAWKVSLDECQNLTPKDMHVLPDATKNVGGKLAHTNQGGFSTEPLTQQNNQFRIESLQQELVSIEEEKKALLEAGEPKGAREKQIHEALLNEYEQQHLWTELKLWIVNTQSDGESTAGMVEEEKALKARYLTARNERESLQNGTRKTALLPEDKTGKNTARDGELTELRTDVAREKQALRYEKESLSPNTERMDALHGEIARLELEIYYLEE